MVHHISVTAQGLDARTLTDLLDGIPDAEVLRRSPRDQLALDPLSVSLIVAGIGSVNALIGAMATVWAARVKQPAPRAQPEAAPAQTVLHVYTDTDEIRVTIGPGGTVVSSSAALPDAVDEITEVHLRIEPAAAGG